MNAPTYDPNINAGHVIAAFVDKAADLSMQLTECKSQLEKEIAEHELDVSELKKQIKAREDAYDTCERYLNNSEELLSIEKDEHAIDLARLNNLRNANTSQADVIDTLHAQIKNLKDELSYWMKAAESRLDLLGAHQTDKEIISDLQAKSDSDEHKIESLQKSVANLISQREQYRSNGDVNLLKEREKVGKLEEELRQKTSDAEYWQRLATERANETLMFKRALAELKDNRPNVALHGEVLNHNKRLLEENEDLRESMRDIRNFIERHTRRVSG